MKKIICFFTILIILCLVGCNNKTNETDVMKYEKRYYLYDNGSIYTNEATAGFKADYGCVYFVDNTIYSRTAVKDPDTKKISIIQSSAQVVFYDNVGFVLDREFSASDFTIQKFYINDGVLTLIHEGSNVYDPDLFDNYIYYVTEEYALENNITIMNK